MPQSGDLHLGTVGQPFRIAQAETGTTSDAGRVGTTANTEPAEQHHPGEIPNAYLLLWNSLLIVVFMLAFAIAARRKLEKVPHGIQNVAEWIVERLNVFTIEIIGPGGAKYTPLVGTIFVYILLMNLIGMIPGFHSPTSNLSITLALGVIVFVYVQYLGIRTNGLLGYLKHFAGPMPAMAPLMFPVELISEIVKPFTLAVRLFGNIFGEDVIIGVLAGLGAASVATSWIPFQLVIPVALLALLTCLVQAMVFTILTCIYISLMTHHEGEEHGEDGSHLTAHAHATGH